MMTNGVTNLVAAVMTCLVLFQTGCSRAPALSSQAAAQLAAELANDECDRLHQQRPFNAAQHPAILQKGIYTWGGLDVTGPGGFSALVTFRADGSNPQVEIFFSHDILWSPSPRHLPFPENIPFQPQ